MTVGDVDDETMERWIVRRAWTDDGDDVLDSRSAYDDDDDETRGRYAYET